MNLRSKIIVIALLMLAAAGCKRHTIIPDDELARIFHDAFLVNAYVDHEAKRDSLNVYEPIFERYGYTTADVQYTIGNFSKRKSARLGDVVEQAIVLLEAEGKYYDREVAILDTIDRVAERTQTRRVYSDSLIRVRSLRDTARLRIAVDVRPGSYVVEMNYRVDSLDRNSRLQNKLWLEKRDSSRSSVVSATMWRNSDEHFKRSFKADSTHRRLHVDLGCFDGTPRQPSITITDLRIDYTPETSAAVDALYDEQLNVRIFAEEFFKAARSTQSAKSGSEVGAKSETNEDDFKAGEFSQSAKSGSEADETDKAARAAQSAEANLKN